MHEGVFPSFLDDLTCLQLDTVLQFHVGETVTGLRRAALSTGSSEAVVYSTIMGTIGSMVPFLTKEEVSFLLFSACGPALSLPVAGPPPCLLVFFFIW